MRKKIAVIGGGISGLSAAKKQEKERGSKQTTDPKSFFQKILEDGQTGITFNGKEPWDPQVHNEKFYSRVVSQGSLGLGETYMEGWWDCEDLPEFFNRVLRARLGKHVDFNIPNALLYIQSILSNQQDKRKTLRVGTMHYDLPNEVWEATLDTRMTGSTGYYPRGDETLDEAQEAKKKLLFDKLAPERGQTLLDIGVGWGSFVSYAAEQYGMRSVGVTVSSAQRDYIYKRYGKEMVDVRVHDYRDTVLASPVDRAISVEMFEHVGQKNYRTFFELVRKSLKEDGRFVLQTSVNHRPIPSIDPWMNKYIYPGGALPTVGQVGTAVHGLFHVEDVHDIGVHYERTLRQWIEKFRKNRTIVKALGKERLAMDPEVFCRMWDYHYLSVAGGFKSRIISVHQYLLSPHGIPGGYRSVR